MTNVTGFLMRTSLSDTGALPRTGTWTGCPDIIPAGISSLSRDDLIKSYGSMTEKPLQEGVTNYLYLRAKNMNDTPLTQVAYMFQVAGSLVLHPSVWFNTPNLVGYDVKNDHGDGTPDDPKIIKKYQQSLTADPHQVVVTDAFTWKPDNTEHHCLVGVIGNSWGELHANVPREGSMDALAQWIYMNGSFGWHNVNIQPITSEIYEAQIPYRHSGADEPVTFAIIANNVPVGARVSFSAGNSTASGQAISQTWVTVTEKVPGKPINDDFEVATTVTVNKDFKTIITYRTDFAGLAKPADFAMHMKASVATAAPTPANSLVAAIHRGDNFSRSYYRSHSPTATFRGPNGENFGTGIAGYRAMLSNHRLSLASDNGDLEDEVVVIVGSHTTTPVSS